MRKRKDGPRFMKKLTLLVPLLCLPADPNVFSSQTFPVQSPIPTPTAVIQTTLEKEQPEFLSKQAVAKVIARAGFPKNVVPIVTCLAEHESHFNPTAVNENKNKSLDYGLLQINSVWLRKSGC